MLYSLGGNSMQQKIDFQKAMHMLNHQLQNMRKELAEIDEMSLKGTKKQMAKRMHQIYNTLEGLVENYSKSQSHDDFNKACRQLESLEPAFIINYNEICYENGLEKLNETLEEMEKWLHKVDKMKLSGAKGEKAKKMHWIYEELSKAVEKYAHTHEHNDFDWALSQVEKMKPEFTFSFNELCA